MSKQFNLHIGALAKPLKEQLSEQGLTIDNVEYYEKVLEARTYLFLGGFVSDSENQKIVGRIFKELHKKVKENCE